MSRKYKFTEAELKHLLADAQISGFTSVRESVITEIDRSDVPDSVRFQYAATLELLDAAIAGLEAEKETTR